MQTQTKPLPRGLSIGDRFGRLVVIGVAERPRSARFRCDCGTECVRLASNVKRGMTKSCGCYRRDVQTTHGQQWSPTYNSWFGMKQRCLNPNSAAWRWYGAKGVRVCDRWLTFENFLADMGERPEGLTLDRINPFGDYEPSNCRWATRAEQSRNQRRHHADYAPGEHESEMVDAAFAPKALPPVVEPVEGEAG